MTKIPNSPEKVKCDKECVQSDKIVKIGSPNSPGLHCSQTPSTVLQAPEKDICGKASCRKEVKSGQVSIQCELCLKWFHKACSALKATSFTALDDDKNLHWRCPKCKPKVSDLFANIGNFERLVARMESLHDQLDLRITGMESELGDLATENANRCDLIEAASQTRCRELQDDVTRLTDQCNRLQVNLQEVQTRPPPAAAAALVTDGDGTVQTDVVKNIRSELRYHRLSTEHQEQWTRRNHVRIKNVKETRDENTLALVATVCSDIGVNLKPGDISTAHRTGKRIQGRNRDIICWFTRRETKYSVMRSKNRLKNVPRANGVFIDEDLTVLRARVVRELRKEGWFVQTHDGKIHARKQGEDDIWVDHPQEFARLPWGEEKFKELGITPDF